MNTLDLIADLIAARKARNADLFARALIALEARMSPDDIADLIAAVDGALSPAVSERPPVVVAAA